MAAIEAESATQGRQIVRCALQAHLDGRGDGDVGPAIIRHGPDGDVVLARTGLHTRRLVTLFGEVTVTSGYGAGGEASIHPLDGELALPARSYSYEICRRLVRAAVCGPFDEAIQMVAETTGVRVPKRSAELIVIEASVDFAAYYACRDQSAVAMGEGEILIGAVDGKGIPMVKAQPAARAVRRRKGEKTNKKKMAVVGTVFSQPPPRAQRRGRGG